MRDLARFSAKEEGSLRFQRHPLPCFALGCAVALIFLWPWLPHADRVPFGIEGIGQQTVWQAHTYQGIRNGRFDAFAPEILAGYPIWAETEAIPLYPFKAAFAVLPANQALAVTWLFHFVLWFAGICLLVYTATRSVSGAVIAGWVGSFSGPMLGTALGGHLSQFAAFAWLPWMAWAWMKSLGDGRARFACMGALFLFLSLAAGHPQYSLMAALAAAVLAVPGTARSGGSRKDRLRLLLRAGGTALCALLAAGAWLLPLRELVSFSNRAGGFSPELLELGSLHIHQLATVLLPHPYGNTAEAPYVDLLTFVETTCFLGVFPALLILAGASFREPFSRSLWVLTALGLLLAAPCVAVPLGERLDLLGRFQLPIRWRLVSWFALSLLCGVGAARLLERRVSARRVLGAGSAAALLLACAAVALFPFGGLESVLASAGEPIGAGLHRGLLLDTAAPADALLAALRAGAAAELGRAGLFALLGTLLLLWTVLAGPGGIARPLLLCAAVLPGLYGFVRPLVQSVPWQRCGWPEPLVEFLRSREGPFRVQPEIPFDRQENPFPAAYREAYRNFYRYDMTALDWGGRAGIESTTGGFSMLTRPYQALTRIGAASLQMPGTEARRRLNARYVLAPTGAPPDGADPVPRASAGGVGVFEDPLAMPRVSFFAAWEEEPREGGDGLRRVRPAPEAPAAPGTPGGALPAPAGPRPLPYARSGGPGFHTELCAATPGLVVFSELYYPGFEAEVDGRPAPLCLAWDALMAVPVPPGEHRVTLRYRPRTWVAGAWVSLSGLLGWVLLCGLAFRRDRRTRTVAR